jgi:hypothetical protein
MTRKALDKLTSIGGIIAVVVLLVAGGLLTYGHSFVDSNVSKQLAQQQIFFPPNSVWAHATKNNTGEIQARMIPYMQKYSGQEMLTGAQAETYADHFIAYHLAGMPYHGVYSKVSAAALAAKPGSAQQKSLQAVEATVFQGTTLRGLLLEAYGFSTMGTVMLLAAIAAFIGAGLMAILVALGFAHAARVTDEKQVFAGQPVTAV